VVVWVEEEDGGEWVVVVVWVEEEGGGRLYTLETVEQDKDFWGDVRIACVQFGGKVSLFCRVD
jgi:hypothetical protein